MSRHRDCLFDLLTMPIIFYTLALWLILPLLILKLVLRIIKNPSYLNRLGERFGNGKKIEPSFDLWIHAVSVGEVHAATPLVQGFLTDHPAARVIITTMTPTGARQVVDTFSTSVVHRYVPYDYGFAVKRFLDHVQPKVLILMETEIWPNIIRHCHQRNIPVAMANIRLSEKSASRYHMIRPLIRSVLSRVSVFATQTEDDRRRLKTLGADANKIHRTGSTKFEIKMPFNIADLTHTIRAEWGFDRPVIVAGSTHEGEEALLLRTFKKLQAKFSDLLLVIAPRHPERFDPVARLVAKNGFEINRRSIDDRKLDNQVNVQIADTMGELAILFGAADIAVVGGSLIPIRGIGGHNILEPCAAGVPVVFGSNMGNFLEISRLTLEAKAGFQIKDEEDLDKVLNQLLQDSNLRNLMGDRGKNMIHQNTGATSKTLQLILPLLNAR